MLENQTKIAVLIDADNASPRHAEAIFTEIAKLGEAIVRRVFGDFSSNSLRGWSDRLARFALVPVQSVAYTKGKNASDISLVIDAMDLMHQGICNAFCIVSSDSDFTRLAQRLRESGAEVYGFGERKSPESFRQSCRRFFFVENLASEQAMESAEQEPELGLGDTDNKILPVEDALPVINQAYDKLVGDYGDGWVPIRKLQKIIPNIRSDFDTRTYGEERIGDLFVKTGIYTLKKDEGRGWWLKRKIRRKRTRPAK